MSGDRAANEFVLSAHVHNASIPFYERESGLEFDAFFESKAVAKLKGRNIDVLPVYYKVAPLAAEGFSIPS